MKFVRQSVHLQMIYPQAGGVAEIGFEHDVGNRAIHCQRSATITNSENLVTGME
jgi:hypothetical protein